MATNKIKTDSGTATVISAATVALKYGINELKKAELDALTIEILDAQFKLEQYQAIVISLTDKLSGFQSSLAAAEKNRDHSLNTKTVFDELARTVFDLCKNSNLSFSESRDANLLTDKLAVHMSTLINKLIYTTEVLHKLGNLVVRKKALNPLISDNLVSMIGKAGSDAKNAIGLTLVALQSSFAAQARNMESLSANKWATNQAARLFTSLTGSPVNADNNKPFDPEACTATSLGGLLFSALSGDKEKYEHAIKAVQNITGQLNHAEFQMNKAQVKLISLQKGLAAGNAAALAS
ncbi:MAG: hypothetical protein IPL84_01800 [Chitinophagaceae bacterium]|nr:hypothetical protein [Chitinophagaceae bacterium]